MEKPRTWIQTDPNSNPSLARQQPCALGQLPDPQTVTCYSGQHADVGASPLAPSILPRGIHWLEPRHAPWDQQVISPFSRAEPQAQGLSGSGEAGQPRCLFQVPWRLTEGLS